MTIITESVVEAVAQAVFTPQIFNGFFQPPAPPPGANIIYCLTGGTYECGGLVASPNNDWYIPYVPPTVCVINCGNEPPSCIITGTCEPWEPPPCPDCGGGTNEVPEPGTIVLFALGAVVWWVAGYFV